MTAGRRIRVPAALLLALGALVGPGVASAEGDGHRTERHTVVLSATARPGAVRGDGGLGLAVFHSRSVRADNIALASASCDRCSATAVSFQVVLADRGPRSVTVGNAAVASTSGCVDCEATAIAYQFVVAVDGWAQLSPQGRAKLRALDAQAEALARSGRPGMQVQADAQVLAQQVLDVLVGQLSVRPELRVTRDHRERPGHRPAGPPSGPGEDRRN